MTDFKKEIIREYLEYLSTIKGQSQGTVKGYEVDLNTFFNHLEEHNKINMRFLKEVSLQDLHEYITYCKEDRKNNAVTRCRKVAVLRGFFGYLTDIKKIRNDNPALHLEMPKKPTKVVSYLSLQECNTLLCTAEGRNRTRDHCILVLFLNTAIRLSELVNIKLHDIEGDKLLIRGKGDKERIIYLNSACMKALDEYRKDRIESKNDDFLFISEQKKQISRRTVQEIIEKCLVRADLTSKNASVHTLRHTAATLLYRTGKVDILELQRILGHANINTTTIYTHLDDKEMKKAFNSNPLDKNSQK